MARLYAQMLEQLGALPASAVVETNGAYLLSMGLDGIKKELAKLEGGGVLFIDEAYTLNPISESVGRKVSSAHTTVVQHNSLLVLAGPSSLMIHQLQGSPAVNIAKHASLGLSCHEPVFCFETTVDVNSAVQPIFQVLDFLLPEMENRRGKLVVVLAGYEDQMNQKIMQYNEGMPSRFPLKLDFPDYTDAQLREILHADLKKRNFRLEDDKHGHIAVARCVF